MTFTINYYTISLLITLAFILIAIHQTYKIRDKQGGIELLFLLIALSIWLIGSAIETSVSGLQNKIICSKFSYIGISTAPVLLFLFTLKYTNNDTLIKSKNRKYLWIPPIIIFFLVLTNDYHHLMWANFIPNQVLGNEILIYEHGKLFWFHVLYVYLLFFITFAVLVNAMFRFREFYSAQVYILLVPFILAWGGNILYLLNIESIRGLDVTPYSFAFVGIILNWGLRRFNFLDISPIAKDLIIEKMSECLLVVNSEIRILDLNKASIDLFRNYIPAKYSKKSYLIGKPISEVLKFWPALIDEFQTKENSQTEITLVTATENRIFQFYLTILKDRNNHLTGKMATLNDITEQKRIIESEIKARKAAQALQEIALSINSSLNSDQILSMALSQIDRVISYDSASIALIKQGFLELQLIRGFKKPEIIQGYKVPLDNSPNKVVIEKKEPVIFPDIQEAFPKYKDAPHNQIKSVLLIPMFNKNKVIGTLNLDSNELNHFKEEDIPVARAFAAQVAIALENSTLFEKMSQLAIRDPLTGIFNRRHFIESAMIEFKRTKRHKRPFSIILIDIDHFKKVNDTFGHLTGDQVLELVTKDCQNVLREGDVFGRYGGEEFAILLPETQLQESLEVAERVREVIEKNTVDYGSRQIKITASLGVAAWYERCKSIESLLSLADQALYLAKAEGRNCVRTIDFVDQTLKNSRKPLHW